MALVRKKSLALIPRNERPAATKARTRNFEQKKSESKQLRRRASAKVRISLYPIPNPH